MSGSHPEHSWNLPSPNGMENVPASNKRKDKCEKK